MSFEYFKIKSESVAKLLHTDTYFAYFEHEDTDDPCIVSFNRYSTSSQFRAFNKLKKFFYPLKIVKKSYKHCDNFALVNSLFGDVIKLYEKKEKDHFGRIGFF